MLQSIVSDFQNYIEMSPSIKLKTTSIYKGMQNLLLINMYTLYQGNTKKEVITEDYVINTSTIPLQQNIVFPFYSQAS